jgi:hypothetical protein
MSRVFDGCLHPLLKCEQSKKKDIYYYFTVTLPTKHLTHFSCQFIYNKLHKSVYDRLKTIYLSK